MMRQAISVTLTAENITWLKGRVGATGVRSVSALLDQLVTSARLGGSPAQQRSVANTIGITASDPGLDDADRVVRSLFFQTLSQPMAVRERPPAYTVDRTRKKRARA